MVIDGGKNYLNLSRRVNPLIREDEGFTLKSTSSMSSNPLQPVGKIVNNKQAILGGDFY